MAFEDRGQGYRHLDESRDFLRATQAPFAFSASEAIQAPPVMDFRKWMKVKDQKQTNGCVGHADSSALEVCNWIDTGGEIVDLSRWYAYITAQMVNGWQGKDGGASIAGAIAANGTRGLCKESNCPFTGKYYSNLPEAANVEAAQHRLLRHTMPNSYDDIFAWNQTGQGPTLIGVRWWQSFRNCTGVMDHFAGRDPGFHAVMIAGYSDRKDSRGRNYLWLLCSWGLGWANQGWAEVSPAIVDTWCKRQDHEELVMVSDIEEYKAREVIVDLF